jgi:preprotein translocase subunit SecE
VATEADLGRGAGAPRDISAPTAHRGGLFGFIGESAAELKKVEWPGQNQVIQGTVVVLVACIIVGTYLWLNDEIWQQIVKKVLI